MKNAGIRRELEAEEEQEEVAEINRIVAWPD